MAHLDLSLLGGFFARLDGQVLDGFTSDKARALLAYLAAEADRPHRRGALAALLWPESTESHARANLSQALFNLRSILGDRAAAGAATHAGGPAPFVCVTSETIRFSLQSDHHVDATSFSSLLRACEAHAHPLGEDCDACRRHLCEAMALYRGAFLQDLSIADSVPFEEWVALRREHLHRGAVEALQRLAAAYERLGECERGLAHAWRLVELDPWREDGQRQLMRLLALSGQRSAALAQFEVCKKLLADELGVDPEAETAALYEQIRAGVLSPSPNRRVTESPRLAPSPSPRPPVSASPRPLFVAREQELARLQQWLGAALGGQGRVGFVVGEPGSGKTMLLREFAHRAMNAYPELVVAGGSCNAYAGLGDAYLPFAEILRLLSGDVEAHRAAEAMSHEQAERLREAMPAALRAISQVGPAVIDTLLARSALLARARALPDGARWAAQVQEAINRRPAVSSPLFLHDQVTEVLRVVAEERPLLLIVDDLQWADDASVSLLFHLARRLAGQRLLLLGAYRPEEVAAEREGRPHPLAAVLDELQALWEDSAVDLAQADGQALVQAWVEREPNRLDSAFREALYRRTGGHALFTVELLRGLQDRGDLLRDAGGSWIEGPALDWDRLPKRVEAVIAAHISRLPHEEQELLTVASIEGEEFHAEVVTRVLHKDEQEVIAALSGSLSQEQRLVRAISLRRLGELPPAADCPPRMGWFSRYRFRHYLFQRYLYQRLDPVHRAHLHGEVAEALVRLGAAPTLPEMNAAWLMIEDRSDVLEGPDWIASEATMARHYEEAGLADKAAAYHLWAVRRIVYLSLGFDEAMVHAAQALSLLRTVADTPSRLRWAYLACHILAWLEGLTVTWVAPQAGRTWLQALALAERSGDRFFTAHALVFLSIYHRARADLDSAASAAERAVSLAQGGLPDWVLWVEGALAGVLQLRGEFARAARLLAPLGDALLHSRSIPPPPLNAENVALLPRVLWCLGYPDRAMEVACALQTYMLERHEYQFGTRAAVLLNAVAMPHQLRGEVEALERDLQVLRPLVEEKRCFPLAVPQVAMLEGWLHTHRGAMEQGLAEMRAGLSALSRMQIRMRPHYKGLIAEALGRAGRAREGLVYVESALKQVERTNERWYEAELHRLKGEFLLQQGDDPEEVESCYRRAIAVAREQEAKSWELRAAISLARLLREQARHAEAREMLSVIYGWFTEGFDTPDLIEARDLIEELEAG